jgi:hypothetical protein
MISSIEWIPAGVADPNPKKYELSATEQELIQLMQEKGNLDEHLAEARDKISSKAKLPKIENILPPDLRMDEYSSDDDEEEDEGKDGAAIGRLLVGASGDMADDESEGEEDEGQIEYTRDKDSDDESDDDFNDVPDTREFEPVDVEGLEAMGMSHVGMSSAMYMNGLGQDENDDDSEAEDVALSVDDALVVVAKTEDVSSSFFLNVSCPCYVLYSQFSSLFSSGFRVTGSICVRSKERKSLRASRHSPACLSLVSCTWTSEQ